MSAKRVPIHDQPLESNICERRIHPNIIISRTVRLGTLRYLFCGRWHKVFTELNPACRVTMDLVAFTKSCLSGVAYVAFSDFFSPKGLASLVRKAPVGAQVVVDERHSDLREALEIKASIKLRAATSTAIRHGVRIQAGGEVSFEGFVFEGRVDILKGNVTFENCTFVDPNALMSASGEATKVNIIDCKFEGQRKNPIIQAEKSANVAVSKSKFEGIGGGTAILVQGQGSNLTVSDSSFSDLEASAISCAGGAVATLMRSTFERFEYANAAGISSVLVKGQGSLLTVSDCRFTHLMKNVAGVVSESHAEAILKNCIFDNFEGFPATWALMYGRLTVSACSFSNGQTCGVRSSVESQAFVYDSIFRRFTGKPATEVRGVSSRLAISGSRFLDLTVTGVVCKAASAKSPSEASIVDCTFERSEGTAVSATGAGSRLVVSASRFADQNSGAVECLEGAESTISDCHFERGEKNFLVWVDGAASQLSISSSRFADMNATGVNCSSGAKATIEECAFEAFHEERAPAVWVCNSGSHLSVSDCRFADIKASAINCMDGANATAADCTFSRLSGSAAIWVGNQGSRLAISNSQLTDMKAPGIECKLAAEVSIEGCTFERLEDKPAAFAEGLGSRMTVKTSRFVNSRAIGVGCDKAAEATVADCTFERLNTSAAIGIVGQANMNVARCHLKELGKTQGVACLGSATGTVTDCTFEGFQTTSAVMIIGENSHLEVADCHFDALADCTAVRCDLSASADLRKCVFAQGEGRAAISANNRGSRITIYDCKFAGLAKSNGGSNESLSATDGGSIEVLDTNGQPTSREADQFTSTTPVGEAASLKSLQEMIGLTGVKQQIETLYSLAEAEQRRRAAGSRGTDIALHLVFTGNPGTGKTSVARLIGQIYRDLGLLARGHVVEVDRSTLVGQYIGHTAVQTNAKIQEALDGVLFIDEAYTLHREGSENDFGIEAIEAVMKGMEDNRNRLAVIAAGYAPQMRRFIEANPGLKSRFTRTIHFDDYTAEDLIEIYRQTAEKSQIKLTDGAIEALTDAVVEMVRTKDENFGNARDVRTLFERTMERQAQRLRAAPYSDPHLLETTDIPVMTRSVTTQFPALLQRLEAMVGLSSVKAEIKRLTDVAQLNKRRAEQGMPPMPLSLHMVFTGNPGTGKTTVARIVAQMLAALGLLGSGHMVETDRSGLVAGAPGQTALKTQRVIKDALNGVLFIDEAYTLTREDPSGFGQEAVDTLLKEMEDKRDRLSVIVAGYPEEMKSFVNSNPGLASRFTRFIHFDDYSAEELVAIFVLIAKEQGMVLSEDAVTALTALCVDLYAGRKPGFGNGRAVRGLFEKTLENQAGRLVADMDADLREIRPSDLPQVL